MILHYSAVQRVWITACPHIKIKSKFLFETIFKKCYVCSFNESAFKYHHCQSTTVKSSRCWADVLTRTDDHTCTSPAWHLGTGLWQHDGSLVQGTILTVDCTVIKILTNIKGYATFWKWCINYNLTHHIKCTLTFISQRRKRLRNLPLQNYS